MVFSTVGTADFALVPWSARLNLPRFNTGSQHNLLGNEMRGPVPTVAHVEVLDRATLILAPYDLPRLIPATLWARVIRPFEGLCNHEPPARFAALIVSAVSEAYASFKIDFSRLKTRPPDSTQYRYIAGHWNPADVPPRSPRSLAQSERGWRLARQS